jgi:fatty-acyl-CoA synthase
VIIQTSGTTGTPKGAARDPSAAGIGAVANVVSVVPYRRDDTIFIASPLFHSFGLLNFVFGTALGATFVLADRFDPEDSLRLIEEHRCTVMSCVPVQLRRIISLDDDIKSKFDVSGLRIVIASGSVLSDDVRRGAIELFGDVLYDLYGSTEAGWVAIATPEDMKRDRSTVGKPVPGIEIAIFDSEGNRLPDTETGELFVKSKIMFEGYTSGESKDEREGYIAIGDLAHLDDDGYLHVEGRADDMVVVGGENIYPVEIEQTIERLEGVHEVAVLGVPDEEYGQILVAFVAGRVTEEDVSAACKKELASYKVPRRVEVRDELPRTTTGKILKRELIESAEDD